MSLSPLETIRSLWGGARRETRAKQREFIEGYEFPPGLLSKFSMRWPMLSTQQCVLVFDQLRSYFLRCHDACGKMVAMPSRVADAAWHEFILFTRDYTAFCDSAFGFYLHHTPTEAMKEKAAIPESIELSWRLACEQEGIDPLRPIACRSFSLLMQRSRYQLATATTQQKWGANVGKTSPTAARMRMEAATLQGSQQEPEARRAQWQL
jgi:hypothetical protein